MGGEGSWRMVPILRRRARPIRNIYQTSKFCNLDMWSGTLNPVQVMLYVGINFAARINREFNYSAASRSCAR